MGFKTRAKVRKRWSSGDVQGKAVPETSRCDRKRSVTDSRQPSASNG